MICLQIRTMQYITNSGFDISNIVKFFGWFNYKGPNTKALVFEVLDMDIDDYCDQFYPLPLNVIRNAIQQVWK